MSMWDDEEMGPPLPSLLSRLHDASNADADALVNEDADETPFQSLIRHWMNERHAPDILPTQDNLLSQLLDHIRKQSDAIQLLRADPSSSEEEHMRIVLAQTEVERVKFVIRSYLRTRLFKIEKYAHYITTDPQIQERLSQAELDHARRVAKYTDRHYYNAVLQSLPQAQISLDDVATFLAPSMIREPDKSLPVFAHARQKCGRVTLPDGSALEMEKGNTSLVPYIVVEHLVARGEAELV